MLVRRIARPLLATAFVAEGTDALRHPLAHVERTEAAWDRLGERITLPARPSRSQLTTLVRVHGALMTVSATMLALGRAPRTAALTLAALTVPVAAVNQPFTGSRGQGSAHRAFLKDKFVRNLSMLGGALIAASDTAGRPGIAWRVRHARLDHAAHDAKKAVASTVKDARSAIA